MNTEQKIDRSDARAFAKYISEVTAAFVDGKKIEYFDLHYPNNGWLHTTDPRWEWRMYDYRVAPTPEQPTHMPYTFETAPHMMKLRRKSDGKLFGAEAYPGDVCIADLASNGRLIKYADLLRDFTHLDGSVCGTPVADWREQWPKYFVHRDRGGFDDGHYVRLDNPATCECAVYVGPYGSRLDSVWTHEKCKQFTDSGIWVQIPASEALKLTGGVE